MNCYFVNDIHIDQQGLDLKPGTKQTRVLHKWIDENFLPADILCIAGDIADDSRIFMDFLAACRDRYADVVFVFGDHDISVANKEYPSVTLKCESINNWVGEMKRLCTSTHKIKTKFTKLDGKEIVDVKKIPFVGCMGAPDCSYISKILGQDPSSAQAKILTKMGWKKWWSKDPLEISGDEHDRLAHAVMVRDPRIVVTHFVPLGLPCPTSDPRKACYQFQDVGDIINMLPNGTIWHFGHTHARLKMKKDGILFLSNPIGLPGEKVNVLGDWKKEDFLIEL